MCYTPQDRAMSTEEHKVQDLETVMKCRCHFFYCCRHHRQSNRTA